MVSKIFRNLAFASLTSHNLFNETLFAFFQPTLDQLLLGDVATASDDAGFASKLNDGETCQKGNRLHSWHQLYIQKPPPK